MRAPCTTRSRYSSGISYCTNLYKSVQLYKLLRFSWIPWRYDATPRGGKWSLAGRGRGEPPCVAQLSRIWVPWWSKSNISAWDFFCISNIYISKWIFSSLDLKIVKACHGRRHPVDTKKSWNGFLFSCVGFNRAVPSRQVQTPQRKELIEAEPRIAMVDTKGDRQSWRAERMKGWKDGPRIGLESVGLEYGRSVG